MRGKFSIGLFYPHPTLSRKWRLPRELRGWCAIKGEGIIRYEIYFASGYFNIDEGIKHMPLRVGVVGGGFHLDYVLDGLTELEDARLCAVAPGCPEEDIAEFVNKPAVKAASPKIYQDYRRMLDEQKLDILAINPFFYLHSTICMEALRRGIAPFCEKPLALDLESLDALRKAQKTANLPVGMILSFRYEDMFYTARELVRSGVIGKPIVGYAQKSYKLGERPQYYARRETFGGIIPWVGTHAIDWFQWVSSRHYKSVCARHSNLNTPQYAGMEDHATCLFELDNGGSAVMSFDFLRPDGAPTHADDRLRLVGSHGCLEIRFPTALELFTQDGPCPVKIMSPPHNIFEDFALSVRDRNHHCMITTEETFTVTEIALKTREAADTGKRILL